MKIVTLPNVSEFQKKYPLLPETRNWILESRKTIGNILQKKDPRFLLIVGPCSIHDITAAEEFASRLKELQEEVSHQFFIVMRTYFEKARTNGGWKGFVYDPFLDNSFAIHEGLLQTRRFLLQLAEWKIPAGAELINPLIYPYYDDLLSWGSIGARTCNSQLHREMASDLPFPVGVKNSLDGSIENAVMGISVAINSQKWIKCDERSVSSLYQTAGNLNTHLVLRGGKTHANYQKEEVEKAFQLLKKNHLPAGILVDCSHGNSQKKPNLQPSIFHHLLDQVLINTSPIRGAMIESHLFLGNQRLQEPRSLSYGISITDPCLDFVATKKMILEGFQRLETKEEVSESKTYEQPFSLFSSS